MQAQPKQEAKSAIKKPLLKQNYAEASGLLKKSNSQASLNKSLQSHKKNSSSLDSSMFLSARDNESDMAFQDANGNDLLDELNFDDAEGQIDTGDSLERKESPVEELYIEDRVDLPYRKNPK